MELTLAITRYSMIRLIIKSEDSDGLSSGSSLLETLSHHSASVAEPSSENITDKPVIVALYVKQSEVIDVASAYGRSNKQRLGMI